MSNPIWPTYSTGGVYETVVWSSGGDPVKARWHKVHDLLALVDEADGEVLATVEDQRGIWIMRGDGEDCERYISESAAKKRAEEYAEVDEIVVGSRQNSAGIP